MFNPQIIWPVRKTTALAQCPGTLTCSPALLRLAGTYAFGTGVRGWQGIPVPPYPGSKVVCSWAAASTKQLQQKSQQLSLTAQPRLPFHKTQ